MNFDKFNGLSPFTYLTLNEDSFTEGISEDFNSQIFLNSSNNIFFDNKVSNHFIESEYLSFSNNFIDNSKEKQIEKKFKSSPSYFTITNNPKLDKIEININEKEKGSENELKSKSSFSNFISNKSNNENNHFFQTKKKKERKENYLNQKRDLDKKKPGKISFKVNPKKEHSSRSYDNLQLKIQVDFQTFLINLANDALTAEFGIDHRYGSFKNIRYSEKKNITLKNFFECQKTPIKAIIGKEINKKFKHLNKDNNKKLLNDINKKSEWLKYFFNMEYLELFKFYFNQGKKVNKIVIKEKEILLSKKTKTFYDLLHKNQKDKSFLFSAVKRGYPGLFKFITL